MSDESCINIEYDSENKTQYICWTPALTIVASGITKLEVLNNLKEAAHFLLDSLIDQKYQEFSEKNQSNNSR